jgi:hypothetical protein
MKKQIKPILLFICALLPSVLTFAQDESENSGDLTPMPIKKEKTEIIFKADDFKTCGDTLAVDGHLFIMDSTSYNSCHFGSQEGVLWLYPAQLSVVLHSKSNTGVVKKVTIEYADFCRPGCFTVESKNSDGIVMHTNSNETTGEAAKFEIEHGDMRYLSIAGGESQITKIIIEYYK